MAKEVVPTCGYRLMEDGSTQSKIFELEEGSSLPSGWVDSPSKCGQQKPARKPGRPKKGK